MLQIQRIRQESEAVIEGLKKRGIDASKTVHALIKLDANRRAIRHEMEENQHRLNGLSKEIGDLFKSGLAQEANALKQETRCTRCTLVYLVYGVPGTRREQGSRDRTKKCRFQDTRSSTRYR